MSDQLTLRAEAGRETGSRSSRRIRRDGGVPAIVYGRGMDPVNIVVNHHDLLALLTKGGANAIISLEVGSDTHTTMPKVVQRHPYRNQIRHVDFLAISLTEKTTADVHLELVGEPAGAIDGGVLSVSRATVLVEALPAEIPTHIEVDVSHLGVNDSLRVEDLPVVAGVEYLDEPDEVIASVGISRAAIEDEGELAEGEAPEGEEVAEGVEAEPAGEDAGEETGGE